MKFNFFFCVFCILRFEEIIAVRVALWPLISVVFVGIRCQRANCRK